MTTTHKVLLVCGSLRARSTNGALLRTVQGLAPPTIIASYYRDIANLPHFNPDEDRHPLPAPVIELRKQIDAVDAVLFCTPEYAGALPGSFKNMLDWTIGGVEICEKPCVWINTSTHGPNGAAGAHAALHAVLTYTGASIIEEACAAIPVPREAIGQDGLIDDGRLRRRITDVLTTLVGHIDQLRVAQLGLTDGEDSAIDDSITGAGAAFRAPRTEP